MHNVKIDNDQEVFIEALYDRHASNILVYLLQQVMQPQDAEDLLLEVFLIALDNRDLVGLTPERQLAWLRRVARNKVIDRYRRNALVTLLPLDVKLQAEDDERTPEQHTLWKEKQSLLYQAISQLSPLQQELIRLRYSNDLRLKDIAALLGRSEGATRKLLSRTLRQLQKNYILLEKGSER